MKCTKVFLQFFLESALMIAILTNECTITDEKCVFYFDVRYRLTMMNYTTLVYPANGKLYKYDVINVSNAIPFPVEDVVSADGWEISRLVTVVNGRMPGPDLIVYEGQEVEVHVQNNLPSEALTIHWHGLYQYLTPWMDGVPWVTQCPIQPGQTFKYNFKAIPKGTNWYHSHMGAQRSTGVFGAFIVRERMQTNVQEHIMQITDWNHDGDADLEFMQVLFGFYENRTKWVKARSLDGSSFQLRIHSGLINGRGRYYDPATGQSNMAPLTMYQVTQGQKYRFRVINAGAMYPFRVSVDNHILRVIASDGWDLEPILVESFIISPGERFDFIITADQPVSNYWVRGITLERGYYHRADAILRYSGATEEEPITTRRVCTQKSPCIVLNCPFTFYPEPFTTCRNFNELKSAVSSDPAPPFTKGNSSEYFLNFAFPTGKSSVNGRTFENPDVNPTTQPTEWYSPCDKPSCGEDRLCKCTFALNIGNGDTVQMVFTNMGRFRGSAHPIHMHGHSFYVLKIGYGEFNETTLKIGNDNIDIDCRGNSDRKLTYCNNATWSNTSWVNGNVPGLELKRPPRKDTVVVPTGGYVVLRIRADNPGLWNIHCHMEAHNLDGMRLLLNESFTEIPPAPEDLPTCHSYPPQRPRPQVSSRNGLRSLQSLSFEYSRPYRMEAIWKSCRHFEITTTIEWLVTFIVISCIQEMVCSKSGINARLIQCI